jgi:hypothetical protein
MKIGTLGFALGLSAALSLPAAADVVVSPAHMGDWAFANSDENGTVGANATGNGQMVNGPATPPLGNGSANIATGNGTSGGDGAEILANSGYEGVALSSITTLSYSTYMTSNNGQQMPYLRLEVTYNGGTAFDQLFFEPPYQTPGSGNASLPDQGASVLNTWQTWDALSGGWWDNAGLCGGPGTNVVSFAACVAALGDAEIVNDRGVPGVLEGVGGIQFTVGFTSDTDISDGNVDNFTIGIDNDNVTYDFEAADASPAPEPFSIPQFGAGLSGLAFSRRRRK